MPHHRRLYSIRGWNIGFGIFIAMALRLWGDPVQQAVPTAYPKSRYEALRAKSPFSLATAPTATPAPQPSFAENWYVGGIGRIGDADFVTIRSRDLATQFSLFGGETDFKTGVSVVSVNWSDVVGKSTVILRKGTETAKLEFNEAEVHGTPALAAGTPLGTKGTRTAPFALAQGGPASRGIAANARPSRFAPSVTPPPGNGPARVPGQLGGATGIPPGSVAVQAQGGADAIGQSANIGTGGTAPPVSGSNGAATQSAQAASAVPAAVAAPATQATADSAFPWGLPEDSDLEGLPRGAAELSGITPPDAPHFLPSVAPPPGNGPARIPWDAGGQAGIIRNRAAAQ